MSKTYFELKAHASWVKALSEYMPQIAAIEENLRNLTHQGKKILPEPQLAYRALSQDIHATKVLILGQDPYPTPGHPVGLAFSADPHVRPLPKSLNNIYKELHDDLGVTPASNGDLTPWEKQGVMLLNTSLSVEAGNAGSHRHLWKNLTLEIVKILSARQDPLVAILWGRDAQGYAETMKPYPNISSAHPSPLSAHRGFFGSKPFSRCNAMLVEQGATPINWDLNA